MRKSNAALLAEIEGMDTEIGILREDCNKQRERANTLHDHAVKQKNEIDWLKQIISDIVKAPPVTRWGR